MSVITISRQYGSGGDEIVEYIRQITAYQLFDKQMLSRAAIEAGLSDQEVIDYAEENYKVKNFFSRLFGSSQPIAQVRVWKEGKTGERISEEVQLTEEHVLALEIKAIQLAHRIGDMVIVGRGGQVILKDCPDVLHVRVEAPLEDRILRVRNSPLLAKRTFADKVEARRAAQDLIMARDAASADYLQRYYNVDWSDPFLYHIVINTNKLGIEEAGEIIVELAHKLERFAEPV